MLEAWLARGWPAILVWGLVFAGDYALTIAGARLYRTSGAKDLLGFDGSYELTPVYQSDIDRERRLSWRFIVALLLSSGLLGGLWWVSVDLGFGPALFAFGVGAMLLREVPVYLRHVHNLWLFRHLEELRVAPGSHIEYPRSLVYRLSATDMAVMAVAWLTLALLLGSWFFLGGAFGSASVALSHARQSQRHRPPEAT
ncbi:MAG TPA: hypothetical protein VLD63_15470 [Anaerolineales bacterium]|nr:hypothetical protein [Anaerolineales bacterium]